VQILKIYISQDSVRVLCVVGSLMTALLQIFGRVCQLKNFENWSKYGEVMTKTRWCTFLTHSVHVIYLHK